MAKPATSAPPTAAEDKDGHADPPPQDEKWRGLVEWAVIIAGALGVALVVRAFLFGAYYIPSASMVPTLNINDRVLVNKLSYKLHPVHRGDVIVFERPADAQAGEIKDLIKRVVAVEDDVVEFAANRLVVNGKQVDEPYVRGKPTRPEQLFSVCPPAEGRPQTCKVPKDELLVMGDNRTSSRDGRFFGPISEDLVIGRAFVQIWPLGDLSTL